MVKGIVTFILTSFLIGNVVAWFSGAAPIEFKEIAFNENQSEQFSFLSNELKSAPQDVDLLIELGQLLSNHNRIDEADAILSKAVLLAPENPLAKAIHASNEGKQAGAMFDPLMGLYKLAKLKAAMTDLNEAALAAPNDFNVRLVRLLTFAFVGEISGHYETVFEDESWFTEIFSNDMSVPSQVKQLVYVAMAHIYRNEDKDKSMQYITLSNGIGPCPNTFEASCAQLGIQSLAGNE